MTPFFTSVLDTEWHENPHHDDEWMWLVTRPFGFVASRGEFIAVPANRFTNGASIPRPVRWIFRPADWYFNASVIHDELCDEQDVFDGGEKHLVYDYSQEEVKNIVAQMGDMPPHVFDGALKSIADCRYKVSSFRTHQIMNEAMKCKPCITPTAVRLIVYGCIYKYGPKWK